MIDDTIAAIATPCSTGALGIIRLSGKDAVKITANIFQPKNKVDISSAKSHTVYFGNINDKAEVIDEVLVIIMRAPHTYTKEDVVEISAHGNPLILKKILEVILKNGARLAEPGEFTKRAFLNGRIDLSQAESVCDIINAKTESSEQSALRNLEGTLSKKIHSMQAILKEMLMQLEANIDFSEDNTINVEYESLKEALLKLKVEINTLLSSYNQGKIEKEGINVPIVGNANSGKSSLFNILVEMPERAIVTHVPGTTRDIIDESVNVSGRLFKFTDTAGFKTPKGVVEEKSLEKTQKAILDSDILLLLFDGSKLLNRNIVDFSLKFAEKKQIFVLNKIDLPRKIDMSKLKATAGKRKVVEISCVEGKGIDTLKDVLVKESDLLVKSDAKYDVIINNVRHRDILSKVNSFIDEAISAIVNNLSHEFIATDIRRSLEALQEITGEHISDTILDDIFSRFCIGK